MTRQVPGKNKLMENYKQYMISLPVATIDVIATKFFGSSTKGREVHYLQIAINLPVKFQMFTLNTFRDIAGSRFLEGWMDKG